MAKPELSDEQAAVSPIPLIKRQPRLLLIDDDSSVLDLLRRSLVRAGYDVVAANSAKQALELMREHDSSITMMITDVSMPGMTGQELSTALEHEFKKIPVIYMSGHAENIFTGESLLPSDAKFIQKPFLARDLVAAIQELIGTN